MSPRPEFVAHVLSRDGVTPVRFTAAPASGGKIELRSIDPFELSPGDTLQFANGATSAYGARVRSGDIFTITYEMIIDLNWGP